MIVNPKVYKPQTLGYNFSSKKFVAGFRNTKLGCELGVLMKNKKEAVLKNININVAFCAFDSVYYRINIYEVSKESNFNNVLTQPIYLKLMKQKRETKKVVIDLSSKQMTVKGDFLVSLEQFSKNDSLGKMAVPFCASIIGRTYYRKSSQGKWEHAPVGISISVDALVQK
jgi:hypothetical protein